MLVNDALGLVDDNGDELMGATLRRTPQVSPTPMSPTSALAYSQRSSFTSRNHFYLTVHPRLCRLSAIAL